MDNNIIKQLEKIAIKCCDIETLETRNSDSLDFKEIAVWTLKDALIEAYKLGMNKGEIV